MTQATGTRWISRDLSHLYTQAETADPLFFDVVIVGSGYGGAMAAAELAGLQNVVGKPVSVLVLERGKEYVPGMFPSSGAELPTHMRVHRSKSGETTGWLDGLFDLRIGPDVCALVGNGLGGGSLINAGVMEVPDWSAVPRMPESLREALDPAAFDKLKERLGARRDGRDNTIAQHAATPDGAAKTKVLRSLDPGHFRMAAVTMQMEPGQAGSPWKRCELCGDCMTGCNVGAKKSLDTTLLLEAHSKGAEIYTGASVTSVRRGRRSGEWEVSVVFTGESLRRRHAPLPVRAGKVILAAGTFGSPEILMHSQNFGLKFSPRLGQQFSCNGDNLLALRNVGEDTNSVAPEHVPLDQRKVGPTITGIVDVAKQESGPAFLIQEFAIPGSLKLVLDELVTTSSLLNDLARPDREPHSGDGRGDDPLAVSGVAMKNVLVLGLIGHDESSGQLRMPPLVKMDDHRAVEGRICIDWPAARKSRLVDDAYARLEKLVSDRPGAATPLPNPLWRMLPEDLDFVFRSERGPLITVHPLGGCPIGPDRDQGVVDEYGRVYDFGARKSVTDLHDGLRVLDGSIIPSSLGANPALTIAAVAQRAARQMAMECGWSRAGAEPQSPRRDRPRFRSLPQCTPPKPADTQVELIEKLTGPFRVGSKNYMAELTLQYIPVTLESLTMSMQRCLEVLPGSMSTLRIYDEQEWDSEGVRMLDESLRSDKALFEAPVVRGDLTLLHRESSNYIRRIVRGLIAYGVNRGLRDARGRLWELLTQRNGQWNRLFALAGRAGEVRRFDYKLEIGAPLRGQGTPLARLIGKQRNVVGEKRFTYSVRGNPWRQLMELRLTNFLDLRCSEAPVLQLDGRFMARQAVPLARIVTQQNQMHALAETASFGLYLLRLFISVHVWSFRAPEAMPARKRELLPGKMKGPGEPEIIEIELEPPRHGIPVLLRLSRYRGKHPADRSDGAAPPLVMIHGYSASGSSFTHPSIPQPMARFFWEKGRDVWVLDLRTSAGMPSAVLPWHLEDAALADIPLAIQRILQVTGRKKVDVFAHCIGAVMLSMGLLTENRDPKTKKDTDQMKQINAVDAADGVPARRYLPQVQAMRDSIRKIVLSQKGPALVYSDGNVLRGYLMRVLRRLVLPENYQFRATPDQSLAEQGFDRLLSSLPYPDDELRRENPVWPWAKTPWVGFRHRVDALYARAFRLKNIDRETLAAIEDLFGPLNLDTVSQAVHFALYNRITNGAGRSCFVTVKRMRELWPPGGTMSIHGRENGLADVRTLTEMKRLMEEAGHENFKSLCIPGYGHQDCIIGIGAHEKVFEPVAEFLS